MTTKEVCENFDVFENTSLKYMRLLSESDLNYHMPEKRHSGISYVGSSDGDANLFLQYLRSLKTINDVLKQETKASSDNWIIPPIDTIPNEVYGNVNAATLTLILQGLKRKEEITCYYHSKGTPRFMRFVPLRLVDTGIRWHIVSYLTDERDKDKGIRDLVLSRMTDVKLNGKPDYKIGNLILSKEKLRFKINPSLPVFEKNVLQETYPVNQNGEIEFEVYKHISLYVKNFLKRPNSTGMERWIEMK
jgi:predicted DNA-binding transcriptional regulator YafY